MNSVKAAKALWVTVCESRNDHYRFEYLYLGDLQDIHMKLLNFLPWSFAPNNDNL